MSAAESKQALIDAERIRRIIRDPAFRVGPDVRFEELVDVLAARVAAARASHGEPHAYGVEVLVNPGLSSAYWRLNDDEQVRDTYEEAAEQWVALVDCGYDPDHLRIVALSVVRATGGDRG